jgi:hypothetical protein
MAGPYGYEDMISPSLLRLSGGSHALSLDSLLITETASFSS